MFVFPEDKAIIRGISSVYVSAPKLLRYYREKIISGCIYCKNKDNEGVIFFQEKAIINAFFDNASKPLQPQAVADHLADLFEQAEFTIDVLEIAPSQMGFWPGMQSATAIYSNLSTEFTDLQKLLKKMAGEKLTGYIEVTITSSREKGRIFLVEGRFTGGSYSWTANRLSPAKQNLEKLVAKTKAAEGLFTVYSVAPKSSRSKPARDKSRREVTQASLAALEDLLATAEQVCAASKNIPKDFQTLLKQKFVQLADKYPFLDPFAAEFEYRNGKIRFSATTDELALAQGLLDVLQTLMNDLGLSREFEEGLSIWRTQNTELAEPWDI